MKSMLFSQFHQNSWSSWVWSPVELWRQQSTTKKHFYKVLKIFQLGKGICHRFKTFLNCIRLFFATKRNTICWLIPQFMFQKIFQYTSRDAFFKNIFDLPPFQVIYVRSLTTVIHNNQFDVFRLVMAFVFGRMVMIFTRLQRFSPVRFRL